MGFNFDRKRYEDKMAELREQRSVHQEEIYNIEREMDEFDCGGMDFFNSTIGKYISIDIEFQVTYFKVDRVEKIARGVHLKGHGFVIHKMKPNHIESIFNVQLDWYDGEFVEIIDKGQYNAALDQLKENVSNFTDSLKEK